MNLPFLYEKLQKVCGVPWCGHAMKKRMRISGDTPHGGMPHTQEWWKKIHRTAQDESISGSDTIVEMCGIRWPRVGRVRKTG